MRAAAAVAGAVLCSLLLASPAAGHALLQASQPARGSQLEQAPAEVSFAFSEPVEARFGALRIFDAKGGRVDAGEAFHPQSRGDQIAVKLRPGLADGSYTATYRVISADGHPVSGGIVFAVGNAGPPPSATVAELIGSARAGAVTTTAFSLVRAVAYAAIALGLGGLIFLLWLWRPALGQVAGSGAGWRESSQAFANRARLLLLWAALAGLLTSLLGIAFQGAVAGGTSFWSALDPTVLGDVVSTRFGTWWAVRAVAWAVFLAGAAAALGQGRAAALRPATVGADGLAPPARLPRPMLALLGGSLAVIALTPALSGHATTQEPVALMLPLDLVHVAAMSLWTGGLVMLLAALPAATRRLEPADRSRLLSAVLLRFSPLALACVIALLATGIGQSLIELSSWSDLTGTAFGRAILVKSALMAVLIVLGAVNRQRVIPRLRAAADAGDPPSGAGLLLRRTLRAEVALLAAVLVAAGALVGYPPPVATSAGPYSGTATFGPAELQATVDPAQAGPNVIHVYLFDAKDGSQYDEISRLQADLSLPAKSIGPVSVRADRAGPGHFTISQAPMAPAGTWTVRLRSRVSDFEAYEAKLEVPVR